MSVLSLSFALALVNGCLALGSAHRNLILKDIVNQSKSCGKFST